MVLVPLFGGERPPVFRVAWMLATIYVLAVLGYGVSAGGDTCTRTGTYGTVHVLHDHVLYSYTI